MGMAASLRQRQKAAAVLRANGTQAQAASAAGVGVSTIKRWLDDPAFRAMVSSSPDIRPGTPPRIGEERGAAESQRGARSRMWVAAESHEVLGSYIPPAAFENSAAVLHVHVVPPGAVDAVASSIGASAYPEEAPYIPTPLSGLDGLLENLPLVCRLGSLDERESLYAWLEVWTIIDEEGRTGTLADRIWGGQQRFLEALLRDRHVLSIKSRKVGLSTLVCAHAAWTARIRDVNAAVHLLSYREDAAQELLRALKRGFEGLPPYLRLPLVRETSTVLTFTAGDHDRRGVKVFPATPNAAIEATTSHLVLDEWAHTFDPEAVWTAVEPTLPARATSALITTARTPGDFVHDYWKRSQEGQTRHTPVFVSALERPDRSPGWLEQKRREEGKWRIMRSYPLTAEEAFASAGEPYFDPSLLVAAQHDAMPPSAVRDGDRYVKAWDIGRKDATVCIVLRAPRTEEAQVLHVVDYTRLVEQDFPTIQRQIEIKHRAYPGPTIIEANSIGLPTIQNLNLAADEIVEHTTTQASKLAMLTELEIRLQHQTLKVHPNFQQLLHELTDYRLPDTSITQDSVMALGFAVVNARHAHSVSSSGRINRSLFRELNGGGEAAWLDERDARVPLTRADFQSGHDVTAARVVAAGGGLEAIIEATNLRTRENVLRLIDPAILEQARQNDGSA